MAGWRSWVVAALCGAGSVSGSLSGALAQALPSELPENFAPDTRSFDYEKRDVMIPMRDGARLHAVILLPRGARDAPMLLTITPYSADEQTSFRHSAHRLVSMDGYDNAADVIEASGYIRVIEDIRGKYKSEGDYVMNRPLIGPLNPTKVDDATDAYDTIDWLVRNVPESNGRVGTIGISYDGYSTLMTLVHPHPALKVAVPMNPMVDGWVGDDWFHKGAFRQINLAYIYEQDGTRANDFHWWNDHYDDYDAALASGSAGALATLHGLDAIGFWRKLKAHPAYDDFWKVQAVDQALAKLPVTVPTMLVHSLWDQEDSYGALAVWRAIKPRDTDGKVFLAIGPWHHGQELGDADRLGAIRFGRDTGTDWRTRTLRPFLDQYLRGGAAASVAPVTAFQTGTNRWERLQSWPPEGTMRPIWLGPGATLGFDRPKDAAPGYAAYVADPAKPVPFVQRPIHILDDDEDEQWRFWLASDQREASTRPDVLTFTSATLDTPVRIAGEPVANLVVATDATDLDLVVKLIDVYPDEVPRDAAMGGYELMVSADILRGRYRAAFDKPMPIPAGEKQTYRFALPAANHVFLPGHRIMVQVQSSWFPLYDRNPQTYVENIFDAKPEDYRPATVKLFDAGADASFVDLPMRDAP